MTQVNIEIPDDIAQEFYRRAPGSQDRIRLVETIFREYFADTQSKSELELLNANAEELNLEAEDVLAYQVRKTGAENRGLRKTGDRPQFSYFHVRLAT
jgi:hypothetical protein